MDERKLSNMPTYIDYASKVSISLLLLFVLMICGFITSFAVGRVGSDISSRIFFFIINLIIPISVSIFCGYKLIIKTKPFSTGKSYLILAIVLILYVGSYLSLRGNHSIVHRENNPCSQYVIHKIRFSGGFIPIAIFAYKPLMWSEQLYWSVGYPNGSIKCPR